MTKSRGIILSRRPWTRGELAILRREYPHKPSAEIAKRLGRTLSTVYQRARLIGLSKSAEYLASPASGRTRGDRGQACRFLKGSAPWNKGTHWVAGGRSKLTRFKKGQRPHTWRPIGTERVTDDGTLQRKITDTGCTPRDWKAVHALVWEAANGPIPPRHVVIFKRGRRTTDPAAITVDALELVSRNELMRRNSYHTRYPKEIGLAIQLRGALVRQINKRERDAKQNR